MIELTDWLRAELVRRRDQEAPQEACGLISRGDHGLGLWPAPNVAEDPTTTFAIEPENLLAIIQQIERQGDTLVGVYHSHAGTPAPSSTDVETAARWPGLTWVIVGSRPCECLPIPLMGTAADNDLIPDGDCEKCGDTGTVPDFWMGVLS
jgi:proteasome lid subunit RPN8/RPN11